ncbi:MAG: hypothetical protein GTN89_15575 [Acidobacteria bacterium]|nr:hypothetical protein [Acidobacteriota bacterium]NIQ31748.1 hypothetical protein [Acidobacteriota bacterium]NIQ87053.1 hypothetical protein [Acidobacteriota bacterium]
MKPTASERSSATDRERALEPHLEQLRGATGIAADATSVVLGNQILSIAPWEREALRRFSAGTDEKGHHWPALAREGLAFLAKCGERAQEERTDDAESEDRIDEAAAGVAILRDLQVIIEELVRGGRMKEVKQLSDLRNRIHQGVTSMKTPLGPGAQIRIESRAAAMVPARPDSVPTVGSSAAGVTDESNEARPQRPTQFKRDAAPVRVIHQSVGNPNRLLRPLLVVLVISVAVLFGLSITGTRHVGTPVLTAEEFGHIPIVRSIEARPPSLFVRLNGAAWDGLSAAERLDALRAAASIAEQAGYVGAQFWAPDGSVAGRWSKKNGAELVTESSEGS